MFLLGSAPDKFTLGVSAFLGTKQYIYIYKYIEI